MESTGGSSGTTIMAAAAMPSPSVPADNSKATNFEFDPSISEEERRFYLKAYPTVDVVRERKTHCTVCKIHIGTAPVQENGIKMHPILRVTHCNKCHDFYNSGEFSKGEDGSELYCRWCGQGGEVYCCSSCPYVFCKSCIVKNLSRGVVADIEQNENWNCFSCAPKILWPLRAQHWALMNYIEQQKKELYALNLSESELKANLSKDRSKCCRLAKAKCGNMSDSMESLDSVASKRSHSNSFSIKKPVKHSATPSPQQMNAAKRAKSNDEVVCTPDLLSMLEPDCQITVPAKPNRPMGTPSASTPKVMSIQQPQTGYGPMTSMPKNSGPPSLILRNAPIKFRASAPPPVVRRTIIGPRTPNPGGNGTPVYHTINGYRIDLNTAAQQETFRLPNGKLIQVKRQGPPPLQNVSPSANNWQQMTTPQPQRVIPQTIASRAVQITQHPYNISVQQQQTQHPQVVRYHNNVIGSTAINSVTHNGTTIQVVNGQMSSAQHLTPQQPLQQTGPIRPVMVRHVFPDNPIGQARSGLQDQVFNAMEICTHLTNKVQTLTNSNAYKQARSFLEVKELYIHLSYLLTYAIGRFKSLQDKCLGDMRTLGFGNDADCLENGQLAADKQASDDEDNEIEIVEPKTDLITLDSDDDDEPPASTLIKPQMPPLAQIKSQPPSYTRPQHCVDVKVKPSLVPITQPIRPAAQKPSVTPATAPQAEENLDLMSMAQSFLASMLEVDIQEGPLNSPGSDSSGQKKQPRKKLTNKPNPTLLKQKALMERERLEELKRNDQKLKMKCSVELKKAEEVYPYAKEMLEARAKEKLEIDETNQSEEDQEKVPTSMETDDPNKTNAELANEEDDEEEEEAISSTAEEKISTEENDANETTNEENESTERISTKIVDENVETIQVDMAEKEASVVMPHEKENSVEVVAEMADKPIEKIVQYEETQPLDGNNKNEEKEEEIKLTNAGDKSPREKCSVLTTEDRTLKSLDENIHNESPSKEYPDTTEDKTLNSVDENVHSNHINENKTNEDESPEKMELDESPPIITNEKSIKIDDKESSIAAHKLDLNKIKSNEFELAEEVETAGQNSEKALQSPECNSEEVSKTESTIVERQHSNNEITNSVKSVGSTNDQDLITATKQKLSSSQHCDVEHQTFNAAIASVNNDESTIVDHPVSELTITNKLLPPITDNCQSKQQIIATDSAKLKETIASSSNGNV